MSLMFKQWLSIVEALEDRLNGMSIELHNEILESLPDELKHTAMSVNDLKELITSLLEVTQFEDDTSEDDSFDDILSLFKEIETLYETKI